MEEKTVFDKKSAEEMDEISKTLFAPIYPVIADNIIKTSGIKEGVCIDLGSGQGSLAISIAKKTDLFVYAYDFSGDAIEIAQRNIKNCNLSSQIKTVEGDVHNILFENCFADLIVSRGSMFFWDKPNLAFKEINRILKPGGMAYVGGGFGNKELRDDIVNKMIIKDPKWEEKYKRNMSEEKRKIFAEASSGLQNSKTEIINDDSGFWIVIKKNTLMTM
ncbi:class I SAM-dependent methyltransferase [Methanomicrobium antiquum]|uniref:Class I SAM-dependent methyltransferase n=1 Tax=Methanomicrobium antiquum TaxID=487686 RepID=A0AAF0FUE4_9EURY|nr:class I SAM-dependent methyltransferase [Methanomicrobium antiquum]WFN36698.1 class I SAM-dependent methyltransferase [Methanomicrobium antiquum]